MLPAEGYPVSHLTRTDAAVQEAASASAVDSPWINTISGRAAQDDEMRRGGILRNVRRAYRVRRKDACLCVSARRQAEREGGKDHASRQRSDRRKRLLTA